jgi:acyl-CoA dehydrogenase
MRAVGLAERCLEALVVRAAQRVTFGRTLLGHGGVQRDVAECRMELDAARAMVMRSAAVLDEEAGVTAVDARTAAIVAMGGASLSSRGRMAVATIKVLVPRIALRVMDRTIQVFGGQGVLGNGLAARAYAGMRCLRIADGPDDVHQRTIAGLEAIRVLGSAAGKAALRAKQRASKL